MKTSLHVMVIIWLCMSSKPISLLQFTPVCKFVIRWWYKSVIKARSFAFHTIWLQICLSLSLTGLLPVLWRLCRLCILCVIFVIFLPHLTGLWTVTPSLSHFLLFVFDPVSCHRTVWQMVCKVSSSTFSRSHTKVGHN